MTKTIVIYHGGCRDGFCAAWVVNKYLQSISEGVTYFGEYIKYHPGFYGQPAPDCKGRDVIIVDFCYPLETMNKILDGCKSLTWLDHHKTAQSVADNFASLEYEAIKLGNLKYDFDNNRSGAGIAWDYYFPDTKRPWLVDYVEDRDLWLHKLPSSNLINAYVACLEFNFGIWDIVSRYTVDKVEGYGSIAIMKTEQYVREVCKNVYFATLSDNPITNPELFYRNIPIVNICQVDCSEVLHELCEKHPESSFSMYWFKRADGMYQYGLRSVGDFDVSVVAKLFGGGGHKNAAGFQLNYLLEELK